MIGRKNLQEERAGVGGVGWWCLFLSVLLLNNSKNIQSELTRVPVRQSWAKSLPFAQVSKTAASIMLVSDLLAESQANRHIFPSVSEGMLGALYLTSAWKHIIFFLSEKKFDKSRSNTSCYNNFKPYI